MVEMKDMLNLVVVLIMVGAVLGIGIYVMVTLGNNVKDSTTISGNGERILADNVTGTPLKYSPITSITKVVNGTKVNRNVTSNLYSISADGMRIIILNNGTGQTWNGKYVNVTYVGSKNNTASVGVFSTVTAVSTIPTWLTIIVVVAMAAIILALLFNAFGQGRK